MKAQKIRDFRDLDQHELLRELHEADEQLFRLQFQLSMGQTDGVKKMRATKKDRARMRTVLRERELVGEKK